MIGLDALPFLFLLVLHACLYCNHCLSKFFCRLFGYINSTAYFRFCNFGSQVNRYWIFIGTPNILEAVSLSNIKSLSVSLCDLGIEAHSETRRGSSDTLSDLKKLLLAFITSSAVFGVLCRSVNRKLKVFYHCIDVQLVFS